MISFNSARTYHPTPAYNQAAPFPVPMRGVDANTVLSRMDPDFMPFAYNIYSSERGLYTRAGYREWITGLSNGCRTLLAFHGEAVADNRLFAVTQDGIFPATTSADNPTVEISFGTTTGDAGWGNGIQYGNDAGNKRLLYADGANGYYEYDPGTTTWAAVTGLTGATAADVRFVVQHKLRIWLIEADSANAWYLPVGVYTGAAVEFNFAAQFPNGGTLRGLYNWTVDGGAGTDDFLVAVASSGDVVVYKGDDPSSASTWEIVGKWNIGKIPAGRRLGGSVGGELHILSEYGVISVNDLLRGVDIEKLTGQNSIAKYIVQPIRVDMVDRSSTLGWGFVNHLSDGFLMITRPVLSGTDTWIQYVFNLATNSWGIFRGVPMQCAVEYDGVLYHADDDGNVHYTTGSLDGVDRAGAGGSGVDFSFMTAYSDLGAPARQKVGDLIRPTFSAPAGVLPAYSAEFSYDFAIEEITNSGTPVSPSQDVWDTGLWDTAIWGGQNEVGFSIGGSSGMGRHVAVAVRGSAENRVRLVNLEIYWHNAGPL